ncbi:MAG: class I SAM-dependent methyltransferase [Verrucomicrobia bacterium]|nr:class I SAM-dependent methyltransferase [Verrucomicrobiota bacterium]
MPASKTPFVHFYSAHGIIPTRQDISDLGRHIERRHSLYRHLGLPPGTFHRASVLEFGPGSGHNAVVTGLLGPSRYLLVDGNPPSLKSTNRVLKQHCPRLNFQLHQSSISSFRSKEKFDIVLCEAVIPTQKNPPAFLRHVASFVRPGGVLVFTCMDPISLLPEMLRRWLAWNLVEDISDFDAKVARLVSFFRPDLAALPGMSRRPEDWVIDQILHPWVGPLFSIPQALIALGNRGALLGCSPRFLIDWRWYKSIVGYRCADNSFAVDSYYELGLNLMDFRVRLPQTERSVVRRAENISQKIYDGVFARERGQSTFSRQQMLPLLLALEKLLRDQSPQTHRSLNSFIRYLQSDMARESALTEFRKWWGRGQQYVSCVMR